MPTGALTALADTLDRIAEAIQDAAVAADATHTQAQRARESMKTRPLAETRETVRNVARLAEVTAKRVARALAQVEALQQRLTPRARGGLGRAHR